MLSIDQSAMNSSNSSRIRGAFMAVLFVIFTASISAFTTQQSTSSSLVRPISTTTSLSAAPSNIKPKPYDPSYKSKPPTFNKETQLWEPSAETEPQPYGPFGSFLRGGPNLIIRIVSPNDYDQAVYKYMSQTSCSRAEAQGNMDAFFNNGADWAYQKVCTELFSLLWCFLCLQKVLCPYNTHTYNIASLTE